MSACPLSILSAALLPLAAAGAVAGRSTSWSWELEGFVLVGAMLAVFIAVSYLRMQMATAGFKQLVFTVLTTFAAGWLMPEPVVWWTSNSAQLPLKLWALLGLVFGLCGSTAVITILKLIEKYLPTAMERSVVANLPGGGTATITVPVKSDKSPVPPPAAP